MKFKNMMIFILIMGTLIFSGCGAEKVQNDEVKYHTEILDSTLEGSSKKVFDVSVIGYAFDPDTIKVNQGDTVVISLKIENMKDNDTKSDFGYMFIIPEYNIQQEIYYGEVTEFEFVADKRGKFEFFTNEVSGKGFDDIRGTLIVE